jgi:hypothetical protein
MICLSIRQSSKVAPDAVAGTEQKSMNTSLCWSRTSRFDVNHCVNQVVIGLFVARKLIKSLGLVKALHQARFLLINQIMILWCSMPMLMLIGLKKWLE